MKSSIHILARAVIRQDGHILLAHCIGASNTFLPGGHVEHGETLSHAIHRELLEEFAKPCIVHSYLGAIEHAFHLQNDLQHEINHFFRVSVQGLNALDAIQSCEPHLRFVWQPLNRLAEANLQPYPLVHLLESDTSSPWWATTLK
jgi:ADP-ribose pyrophosphatase YjhB (NUDIX family)